MTQNFFQWVSLAISGIGVSFAFGRQAGAITTLKRDMNNIGDSKREIIQKINRLEQAITRLETRLENINK